ncbi:hypothetical protein BGL41_01840 [Fructilactobacillus sanfranciscensis]|uniref:restriction endonuclease subunit S n=1 Tax=Fructilactobacillus sanfranciscensis TaxID=1625 RepID=UPI000D459BE8|nr:restriction endonuclease subunit S [Fructilactobacillus sanfranciscensis]POH14696.1 hypothetical protein BGL41_01840 [Fructilactobacillus sanfranciscensis]
MKNKKMTPRIRFKGFTDAWEERKLTDVTSSYSGLTYSPTDVQDKGTFVLRSSNVKNDQLVDADNVYVNPDIVNSNNVKVGDVIVVVRNGSRSLIGKHAIIIKEMPNTVIGAFMSAFRGQNGDYINALLSTNNFQKEVHKSLGATINQITGKDFSVMNFLTPKLEEQSKIGSFFKQLDDTIALHQRKLDLLKEQKKGYLQKMFPKNGAKVPELRFAGFADDWEERKLSDISNVTKLAGFEFTKYVRYQESGKIIALRGLNVKNGKLVLDEVKYIDDSDFSKLNRSKLYKNDILLTYVGTVGELAIVPENDKYYLAPNVARIRLQDHVNSIFVCQMMNDSNFYNRIISPLIATSSQPALSMENVRKFQLLMPDYQEQEQIGSFFKQLDDTIALHQRKLEKLQELKKWYLQKMFC